MVRADITDEIMEQIFDSMVRGTSLRKKLRELEIEESAFYKILDMRPDLELAYCRAQIARAELEVESMIDIADSEDDPQRARNRIDTRRWYAAKMRPQKYGDRLELNVNQTIDIGAALNDARSRLIPQSDIKQIGMTQRIESREIIVDDTTDQESVEVLASKQAPENSDGSIFD